MPEVRPEVRSVDSDPQTRCAHYRSPQDVVALKMRCCGLYYACKDCHETLADHPIEVWPKEEWDQKAVMCGACGTEFAIDSYLASEDRCPACGAAFNPGCRLHRRFYFETDAQPA